MSEHNCPQCGWWNCPHEDNPLHQLIGGQPNYEGQENVSYHIERVKLDPLCYIDIAEGEIHKTIEFSSLLLDLAKDGTVLGIELLVPTTLVYDREEDN